MKLSLSPEMQTFVDEKVKSGRYRTPEDVLRAGLTNLMQQDGLEKLPPDDLEAVFPDLRRKIAEGLADARAGRLTDGDAFFDELEREDDSAHDPNRKTA